MQGEKVSLAQFGFQLRYGVKGRRSDMLFLQVISFQRPRCACRDRRARLLRDAVVSKCCSKASGAQFVTTAGMTGMLPSSAGSLD
jgi:hypothetical protein